MAEFQLSDLKRVYWPSTAKVAVTRGFCSGLVIAVLQNLMAPPGSGAAMMFLLMPFGLAVLAIPIGLFCQAAGRVMGMFVPALGAFFSIVGALVVCLGDPLVYLLNRQFPALLDVADFKFFNFTPLLFITHPE